MKWYAIPLSLLLLVGLVLVGRLEIDDPELVEPLSYSGDAGERVHAGSFSVLVNQVAATGQIADASDLGEPEPKDTQGVWLVIVMAMSSTSTPLNIVSPVIVTDDGYEYAATQRVFNTIANHSAPFQPGIPQAGAMAFELPPERLPGARLRFSTSEGIDDRLAGQVEIDLGIDAARAAELTENAPELIQIPEVGYP
ncbi:hypothetical protein [Allonocardiopsis opalescens]|uniref:DUF4352 domain-containing protein n=1 Tax=Allonocardiopsis opalescens TaxID=1144618 RepID=A0A2T0Q7R6_9ACTN|nr:hypothetical protein [Allonocardiopsis opalescens]PRX99773.1 hypothetical protein CLV72_103379 [Allonocardiopsis opalescens]